MMTLNGIYTAALFPNSTAQSALAQFGATTPVEIETRLSLYSPLQENGGC